LIDTDELYREEKVIEDEAAETYDSIYTRLSFYEYRRKVFAKYIASLANKLEFPKILEIGCGTGNLTRRMEDVISEKGFIVGLDLSRKMIGVAKQKMKFANFVTALGEKLPFVDSSFDLVVGIAILHHLPELGAFFEEISRVLKRKGKTVFYEPHKGGILDISVFRKAIKLLLLPIIIFVRTINKGRIKSVPRQKFSTAHRHLTRQEIEKSLPGWNIHFTYVDVITPFFDGITFDNKFDWLICKIINIIDRVLMTFMRGESIIVKGIRI